MSAPEFVTVSNLIVDDIVLSDGRSFMNTLGGTGSHTLVGMRPWSDRLGFVAFCGDDFAPQHQVFLEQMGVDLRGVIQRAGERTARAWQLFEPDERRIEIFRTRHEDFERLRPQIDEIPPDYLQARGIHLKWGHPDDMAQLIERLHVVNPNVQLAYEPGTAYGAGSLAVNAPVISKVDLCAPDREEAHELTGTNEIPGIFECLLNAGARIVALRMGAAGSLVGTNTGEFYRVPAVPPRQLVDVTGAGNAYCGGFLTGLGHHVETARAAARAAAGASFAIEQIGIPHYDEQKLAEAHRRCAWAMERIEMSRDLTRLLAQ